MICASDTEYRTYCKIMTYLFVSIFFEFVIELSLLLTARDSFLIERSRHVKEVVYLIILRLLVAPTCEVLHQD